MSEASSDLEKTTVQGASSSVADGFEAGQIVVGKYKIVSLLGRGGIGSVYKVEQVFLGQSLALKTLNSQTATDQLVRRFQNEARAASSLSHANLVKVIDFGLLEGQQPYLVMDLVEGPTLSEYLKQNGPLSLEQAVGCFTQVCLGLSYAHDQGVIHRDIKPSNVMIFDNLPFGAEGFVKVVDFGIAKIAYAEDGEAQSLTTTGEVFGSPLYMSPEQCSGQAVDHRTDIYSLGCVLFEALTGTTPFVGQNALTTMMMHQSKPTPTLKEASLGKDFPQELEQIVGKLLEKSPADRYQNLGVVANDLAQLFKGAPVLGVKSHKKQSKKVDQPVKMSLREIQMWLVLTAIGAGFVGGGLGYYLAHAQLQKDALKNSSSAVVEPGQSGKIESKKDRSPELFEGATSSELAKYEPLFEKEKAKAEHNQVIRDFNKKYFAARETVDKASASDKVTNQKGLKQFLAIQKESVDNPELKGQFASSVEERIAVCNIRLRQCREAEKHLGKAKDLASTRNQQADVALLYQGLAECALHEKRYPDAFNNYESAAKMFEKIYTAPECKPDMAQRARQEAGNSYRCCCAVSFQYIFDYKRAIEIGEKAKRILEPVDNKYLVGSTLVTVGVAYWRDNQPVPARKNLIACEKYLLDPDLPRDTPYILACALNELAAVETKLGEPKKGLECARRALKALARFKIASKAEQKGIDDLRNQVLGQIKNLENTTATAGGSAGAAAGGSDSQTTSASTNESK